MVTTGTESGSGSLRPTTQRLNSYPSASGSTATVVRTSTTPPHQRDDGEPSLSNPTDTTEAQQTSSSTSEPEAPNLNVEQAGEPGQSLEETRTWYCKLPSFTKKGLKEAFRKVYKRLNDSITFTNAVVTLTLGILAIFTWVYSLKPSDESRLQKWISMRDYHSHCMARKEAGLELAQGCIDALKAGYLPSPPAGKRGLPVDIPETAAVKSSLHSMLAETTAAKVMVMKSHWLFRHRRLIMVLYLGSPANMFDRLLWSLLLSSIRAAVYLAPVVRLASLAYMVLSWTTYGTWPNLQAIEILYISYSYTSMFNDIKVPWYTGARNRIVKRSIHCFSLICLGYIYTILEPGYSATIVTCIIFVCYLLMYDIDNLRRDLWSCTIQRTPPTNSSEDTFRHWLRRAWKSVEPLFTVLECVLGIFVTASGIFITMFSILHLHWSEIEDFHVAFTELFIGATIPLRSLLWTACGVYVGVLTYDRTTQWHQAADNLTGLRSIGPVIVTWIILAMSWMCDGIFHGNIEPSSIKNFDGSVFLNDVPIGVVLLAVIVRSKRLGGWQAFNRVCSFSMAIPIGRTLLWVMPIFQKELPIKSVIQTLVDRTLLSSVETRDLAANALIAAAVAYLSERFYYEITVPGRKVTRGGGQAW